MRLLSLSVFLLLFATGCSDPVASFESVAEKAVADYQANPKIMRASLVDYDVKKTSSLKHPYTATAIVKFTVQREFRHPDLPRENHVVDVSITATHNLSYRIGDGDWELRSISTSNVSVEPDRPRADMKSNVVESMENILALQNERLDLDDYSKATVFSNGWYLMTEDEFQKRYDENGRIRFDK